MNKIPILSSIRGWLSFVQTAIPAQPTTLPAYFNNAGRTEETIK
jgi:hypothetical protein